MPEKEVMELHKAAVKLSSHYFKRIVEEANRQKAQPPRKLVAVAGSLLFQTMLVNTLLSSFPPGDPKAEDTLREMYENGKRDALVAWRLADRAHADRQVQPVPLPKPPEQDPPPIG